MAINKFNKVVGFDDDDSGSSKSLERRKDSKTIFCPKCGYNVKADAPFCPKCGNQIAKRDVKKLEHISKKMSPEFIENMKKGLDGKWIRIKLDKKEVVSIGRDERCDISVKDVRFMLYHALFRKNMNKWYLYDSSISGSVFVNNRRITNATEVFPGDVIQIFDARFVFFYDELAYSINTRAGQLLQIRIDNKSVRSNKFPYQKKELIKNINIDVPSGEFVLVLGGSGAGKTTFMNAVLGLRKAKGQILLNGIDLYNNFNQLKYRIGYVPQFSLVRSNETVENAIIDAARIKLPSDISDAELMARVDSVISMLALVNHRTSLFSKLSGGQKNRVCVAIEAVVDPGLFFLDEPDSGLDGVNSRHLMEILHKLALQDKIVMTITHAPNNAQDLFTKIIVLAKSKMDGSGHLAFYGTVERALQFFEVSNLQDIILRINPADEGGEDRADEFIKKFNVYRK